MNENLDVDNWMYRTISEITGVIEEDNLFSDRYKFYSIYSAASLEQRKEFLNKTVIAEEHPELIEDILKRENLFQGLPAKTGHRQTDIEYYMAPRK